jgi:hypothetical protein
MEPLTDFSYGLSTFAGWWTLAQLGLEVSLLGIWRPFLSLEPYSVASPGRLTVVVVVALPPVLFRSVEAVGFS